MFKIIGADQQPYGPVTADQIRQWVAQGRANAQTLAQAEGTTEWKPLASFSEFSDLGGSPRLPGPLPPPGSGVYGSPHTDIPSYMVPAVVTTVCCCLPFGIVAIIYAAQVRTKANAGDLAGAAQAAQKARLWVWIAFGSGIVFLIAQLIVYFAIGTFQFSIP